MLDLEARSMRDNLMFCCSPKTAAENPKTKIKDFIKTHLKLPPYAANN